MDTRCFCSYFLFVLLEYWFLHPTTSFSELCTCCRVLSTPNTYYACVINVCCALQQQQRCIDMNIWCPSVHYAFLTCYTRCVRDINNASCVVEKSKFEKSKHPERDMMCFCFVTPITFVTLTPRHVLQRRRQSVKKVNIPGVT